MGYGIIHVWIMTERCQPAIGARWIVDLFNCKGGSPYGWWSFDEGVTWEREKKYTCWNIRTPDPNNPHVTLKAPPGCYKVDARQIGCQNPVHETMVVLPSLAEVNVYLIAGTDGWLRRIIPVIDVRARMRPVGGGTDPEQKEKPAVAPYVTLKEAEVKTLKTMLKTIQATIPVEERAPINPEAVGCWIETVDTAEAKEALTKHREFMVE